METPKAFNKDGSLTEYSLSCGYVERKETRKSGAVFVWTTLWKEHSAFHVRSHEFEGRGRLAWDTFDGLTEARKAYRKHLKSYHS